MVALSQQTTGHARAEQPRSSASAGLLTWIPAAMMNGLDEPS